MPALPSAVRAVRLFACSRVPLTFLSTLLLVTLPWINPVNGGPSVTVEPWLITAACAVLLFALRGWTEPRFPPALWLALAGLVTAAHSLPKLDVLALFGALLLIIAMSGVVRSDTREQFVRAIAAGWLLAAVVSSLFALAQYFGVADPFFPWISHAAPGEASANLRQRNQFASLMAIGLAALLWYVRRGWSWRQAALPLLLLAAGSAASISRTGALEWVLLLVMAALWRGAARRQVLVFASVGLLAYVIAAVALPWLLSYAWGISSPSIFARFGSSDGCASRRLLWANVLHLIAQHPWTGWGWGELDYAHYITLYAGPRYCDILDNGHSLPLHLAVELGVPVALLVCGALASALLGLKPWREADPTRQLALSVLAAILLHSLLEYPLWYGPFQMAFGLSLGILWLRAEQASQLSRRAAGVGAVIAGLAVCALVYVAWDYRRISQAYLPPEARLPEYRDDPLPQLRKAKLFRDYAQFAELGVTPVTRDNAQWTYETALELLHYSPEPRVIEKVIDSALLLGQERVALAHLVRYRAAFPKEFAETTRERTRSAPSSPAVVKD